MRFQLATRLATFALATFALAVGACTGSVDAGSTDPAADAMAEPGPERMVDITGPAVLPHVQRYANAVCTATGACTISTYEGHQPVASRALDTLISDVYGSLPTDGNALGDEVAAFALAHQHEFGVTYVIFRQRINLGSGWDPMEDRGSITQNHYDHVHVSFDETAP